MAKEMDTLPEEEETQISDDTLEEHDETDEMSDEEFENYVAGLPSASDTETQTDTEDKTPDSEEETDIDTDTEETDEPDDSTDEDTDDEDVVEEPSTDDKSEEESDTDTPDKESDTEDTLDYKEAYKKIMSPFKANGKEIVPESEEDVIALMQMGANYTKKMAMLKPNLKTVKTLEQAGIDSERLNFLIDLHNKNPEAVKKLISDTDIDPLELDTEEKVDYQPTDHAVSDEEVVFDTVVSELSESEHFGKTRDIVTKVWDDESKRAIAGNPTLLKQLHEEVQMDRYDKVQGIIDRERMFGRLDGVPDIKAYIDIVTKMTQEETPTADTKPSTKKATTKPKIDPSVAANKKKAAKTTHSTKQSDKAAYTEDELMSMDDEQFEKLSKKGLF